MKKYVYPCLAVPTRDFGYLRISGPGLANCMFIAARAYSYSKKYGAEFVEPTWFKFSPGPYLRREKDKRHYYGLFEHYGVKGIKKYRLIRSITHTEQDLASFENAEKGVLLVSSLGAYFNDIVPADAEEYFEKIISSKIKKVVNADDFANKVAVHVRLGDYVTSAPQCLTPIEWYVRIISDFHKENPHLQFCIFSDGTDEELKDLLVLPNTKRVFYGNALSDIYAISKCKCVIGSHSTFSAWGAYLGHKPVVFYRCDFAPIYSDASQVEYVLGNYEKLPADIIELLKY